MDKIYVYTLIFALLKQGVLISLRFLYFYKCFLCLFDRSGGILKHLLFDWISGGNLFSSFLGQLAHALRHTSDDFPAFFEKTMF